MSRRNTFFSYLPLISLIGISILLVFYSLNRVFDNDEFEAIHSAWKIAQGQTIFVDFFQHHHPFLYYLLVPIIKLFGATITTLLAARLLMLSMVFAMGMVTYFLARTIFNKQAALISLFVLYAYHIFVIKAIEIRPDVPMVLFGMIALLFLFTYLKQRSFWQLIISALSLGVSFLFLQKAIFFMFFVGIALLIDVIRKQTSIAHLLQYGVLTIVPILAYLAYLLFTNTFREYFIFNWILNMRYGGYDPPTPAILYSFSKTPLTYLLYAIALMFYLKKPLEKYFGFISLGLFASVLLYRLPYQQYLLPATLPIAILVAHSICSFFAKYSQKQFLIPGMILVMSLFPTTAYLKRIFFQNNKPQIKKIRYVASILDKNDYVHDFNLSAYSWNLYWNDLDFFWFSPAMLHRYQKFSGYKYDQYKLIKKLKPKLIGEKSLEPAHPVIQQHYRRSKRFNDIFVRIR